MKRLGGLLRHHWLPAALLTLVCTNADAQVVDPPPVILRPISAANQVAKGTSITLESTTVTIALTGVPKRDVAAQAVLFLPEGWHQTIRGWETTTATLPLTIHFHGSPWWAVEEHARRGARNPLLACYFGEGASMYERPLKQPGKYQQLIASSITEAVKHGAPSQLEFRPVEIQSFSAGYGAVREVLKDAQAVRDISRIVLADSLYASMTTESLHATRTIPEPRADGTTETIPAGPKDDQMAGFVSFAREAAAGRKEMLIAHSTIVTPTYCSTLETAQYIAEALNLESVDVPEGALPAADAVQAFPLAARADRGGLHIWQYTGTTPQAHMAIARTIADFHFALDYKPRD